MITDIIKRRRRTATQTKIEIEDKARNVSDAFSLNPEKIKQLTCVVNSPVHLLLIDDIFTTGNTLFACFKALRSAFPPSVRISVATLGFVGG
jgi:predicted amidophosphoribosyltransferase